MVPAVAEVTVSVAVPLTLGVMLLTALTVHDPAVAGAVTVAPAEVTEIVQDPALIDHVTAAPQAPVTLHVIALVAAEAWFTCTLEGVSVTVTAVTCAVAVATTVMLNGGEITVAPQQDEDAVMEHVPALPDAVTSPVPLMEQPAPLAAHVTVWLGLFVPMTVAASCCVVLTFMELESVEPVGGPMATEVTLALVPPPPPVDWYATVAVVYPEPDPLDVSV